MKAAFSDALKRAAIKFGIGRYLYRLEPEWRDWDPAKKTFTERHIITRKDLAGATEAQLTILDDLLARVNKDKSWLVAAIQTKFSRNCPADLSIMEADQVIKGLEKMAAAA